MTVAHKKYISVTLFWLFAASAFAQPKPATPIQHVVVIFQENVSFDHYFGAYPNAKNPPGEPAFIALRHTPAVNGYTPQLLNGNPNAANKTNGAGAIGPFRLDRSQASTADQNHAYTPEQRAVHGGLMDAFPANVGKGSKPAGPDSTGPFFTTGLTMGYYDGNTVTAYWNYAQRFAMSDNSYGTTYGPSTPGAINLVSGQTNGVIENLNGIGAVVDGGSGTLTDIADPDPRNDVCSTTTGEVFSMSGRNIGDLLNAANVTWGFFQGGFDLTVTNPNGTTNCKRSTFSKITNGNKTDYVPHHEAFQYYKSTANPKHLRPTSPATVGYNDLANHQYDVHDFYDAINAGNFPAVNFLKAPSFANGHAGNSDPLDEQTFVVSVVNFLQQHGDWEHTVVIVAYDDSDGWYDHQVGPIVNQSSTAADVYCNGTPTLAGPATNGKPAQGRCGYGPRLPMLVLSPWSKRNYVDHTVTDQTSIIHFIEDNWLKGERIGDGSFDAMAHSITGMLDFKHANKKTLILDPETGEPAK